MSVTPPTYVNYVTYVTYVTCVAAGWKSGVSLVYGIVTRAADRETLNKIHQIFSCSVASPQGR